MPFRHKQQSQGTRVLMKKHRVTAIQLEEIEKAHLQLLARGTLRETTKTREGCRTREGARECLERRSRERSNYF